MSHAHARPRRQALAIPLLLLFCLLTLCACAPESDTAPEPAAGDAAATADSALNPVQQEMRLLDAALRTSITAIANNTPQSALPGIEQVHAARQETETFLHSGEYALLAVPDTLEAFAAQDAAFHALLERYAEALQAGELDRAVTAFGPLLQSCVACHARFRYRTGY